MWLPARGNSISKPIRIPRAPMDRQLIERERLRIDVQRPRQGVARPPLVQQRCNRGEVDHRVSGVDLHHD